jgi:hypothetical protein
MKKHYNKKLLAKVGGVLLLAIITLMIHSCKKDATYPDISEGPGIEQAQAWYESAFPVASDASNLTTTGVHSAGHDLSQIIKPDWKHAQAYIKYNSDVVELPMDSTKQLVNINSEGRLVDANRSRSSFLVLKDGKNYSAFLMTIIADSDYARNTDVKLANNNYQHHDKDFSGKLLYFTPKGDFISGWQYRKGKITARLNFTKPISQVNSNKMHLTDISLAPPTEGCTYYYADYYYNGVLLGTQYLGMACANSSNPDGGDGSPIPHNGGSDGGGGNDGDFPPPHNSGGSGGAVTTPIQINDSTLKSHFPCAAKLIIDSLLKVKGYAALIAPFNTPAKPNLVFKDSTMDWNKPGPNNTVIYQYGLTASGNPSAASSSIFLNKSMLQNSSKLLIASVAIHETIHGVINYNMVFAGYAIDNGDSWMNGLNSWYLTKGLPSNFRDHYEMMNYYFTQAIDMLAAWDNHGHTPKEYEMAMLTGLNNPGINSGTNTHYATQVQQLQSGYDSLKRKFSVTEADLDTFKASHNNAAAVDKLPTSGCN